MNSQKKIKQSNDKKAFAKQLVRVTDSLFLLLNQSFNFCITQLPITHKAYTGATSFCRSENVEPVDIPLYFSLLHILSGEQKIIPEHHRNLQPEMIKVRVKQEILIVSTSRTLFGFLEQCKKNLVSDTFICLNCTYHRAERCKKLLLFLILMIALVLSQTTTLL